jgi:hypothetical protein
LRSLKTDANSTLRTDAQQCRQRIFVVNANVLERYLKRLRGASTLLFRRGCLPRGKPKADNAGLCD